jgi:hypothetical protein
VAAEVDERPFRWVIGRRSGIADKQGFLAGIYAARFRLQLRQLIIII